ncbi:hypothetical protein B0E49_16545 [Polaromonas sp. C04]|mgnify:FL=1|nr:hypothetical protein B0E49_16545 [Polaromonas sp. C04]
MSTSSSPIVGVAAEASFALGPWLQKRRQAIALPLMFALVIVVFSIWAPGFLSSDNMTNVARQSVFLLIVALGQMIVLICGQMDLSVGSVVSLTSVVSATLMASVYAALPESQGLAIAAGLGGGLIVATIVGVLNGLGTAWLGIPSFMMTLGMSLVLAGVTLLISGGAPLYGLPPKLGDIFGVGQWAGVPVPVLVALLLVVATYVLLEWTRFGRHLYAAGGNTRAAQLSGVRTGRVILASFVLASLMAVLSGLLMTARLGTGESTIGSSLPLESIAACVIAGVSLFGGRGRTAAVVVGTLLIMLVENGLNLMQVGAYAQSITIGSILIFAMAVARH